MLVPVEPLPCLRTGAYGEVVSRQYAPVWGERKRQHTRAYGSFSRVDNHSRETWIEAAFAQFNRGGLTSVKVEALSRDLYATKGSVLLALREPQRSHRGGHGEVGTAGDRTASSSWPSGLGTAQERLVTLYTLVGERMSDRGGERTLFSEAGGEGVLDVVARVLERRVDYVTGTPRGAGTRPPEGPRRHGGRRGPRSSADGHRWMGAARRHRDHRDDAEDDLRPEG